MAKTPLICVVLIILSSATAYAETSNSPDPANLPIKLRDSQAKDVAPSAASEIRQWIVSFKNILNGFDYPSELNVNFGAYSNVGSAETNSIDYEASSTHLGSDPEPGFVHEFGHVIFGQPTNQARVLPPCLSRVDDRQLISKTSAEINSIATSVAFNEFLQLSDPGCASGSKTTKGLCTRIKTLMEESRQARERVNSTHLRVVSLSYDEFFADLLAVLVTKQPHSMATESFNRPRDFIDCTPVENGNNDPHLGFCAVRVLLWNRFVAENKTDQSASALLKVAYEAIGAELSRRAQDSSLLEIPNDQRDAALLAEVKKQLDANGK